MVTVRNVESSAYTAAKGRVRLSDPSTILVSSE